MDPTFSEIEITFLKKLAEQFEMGKIHHHGDTDSLGLPRASKFAVLKLFEEQGYIKEPIHTVGDFYSYFLITSKTSQAVRFMEEKKNERKDIVELVRLTLRKHPVTAWCFIALGALLFVATAITQVGGALKVLGIVK